MPELEHTEHATESLPAYTDLGLETEIAEAMHRLRLAEPTPVQCQVIPRLLEGKDCLVRTRPGAGKTNAYLLPIIQSIEPGEALQAILVQPTRSLALQEDKNLRRFGDVKSIQVAVAAGPERPEGSRFRQPSHPNVLVVTPRRLVEMASADTLDLSAVRFVVLDETDVILAGGEDEARETLESLTGVLKKMPEGHQTVLIAADWTPLVLALAEDCQRSPVRIEVAAAPVGETVEHAVCHVDEGARLDALLGLLRSERCKLAVVFCQSPATAQDLVEQLDRARLACRSIDDPSLRSRADRMRRQGPGSRDRTEIVLAQDPASARLSTIPASHVLHFDLPDRPETFVRRLEACSRLSRRGRSIVLAEPGDADGLAAIERSLERSFMELPMPEPAQHPADDREPHREPRGRGDRDGRDGRGGRGRGRDDRGGGRGRDGRDGRGRRGHGGPRDHEADERDRGGEVAHAGEPRPPLHETLPPNFVQSTTPREVESSGVPSPDSRYDAIRRDAELEARGLKPVPRTLGSRFRPGR